MSEPEARGTIVTRGIPRRATPRSIEERGEGRIRRRVACALAAVGVAVTAMGCGPSTTRVAAGTRGSGSAVTGRVTQVTPVSGLPATASVADVAMAGSVAWVLTDPSSPSIWRTTPHQAPSEVVDPPTLAKAGLSGLSIAGWADGLVLTGFACGSGTPTSESCTPATGVVELFDRSGTEIATTKLWSDGGGIDAAPPRFLGADADGIWLAGPEKLYRLDGNGQVTGTIERTGGDPCDLDGTLYQVNLDEPALQPGKPLVPTDSSDTDLPPATVSLGKWTGTGWKMVDGSSSSGAGPLPKAVCGGDHVEVFDASTVKMTWTPSGGWKKATANPDASSPSGTAVGSAFPTFTDTGDVFRLGTADEVTWFDPTSGALVRTGLTLSPGPAESPLNLRAARSGDSFFACVDRSVGLPRGTAKVPDPHCGFAPLPKG